MIKKTLAAIGIMTGILCGVSAKDTATVRIVTEPSKVLIAYYSWSEAGNTRYAAQQIQKATGGTLFEIKPETAYPSDYSKCVQQAKKEIRGNYRPKLSSMPENFDKYKVIFIGSPNWWGTMAPPVASFIEKLKLTGKTVIPFFTHGSGGMQNCERDVRKMAAKANLMPAKAFTGATIRKADKEIADWVNSMLNLKKTK